MMIIGVFNPVEGGGYEGYLSLLSMHIHDISIMPAADRVGFLHREPPFEPSWLEVAPPDCRVPDYSLYDGEGGEYGVGWDDGDRIIVYLDDPRFYAPLCCRLIKDADGYYELMWVRNSGWSYPRA
jgi:uncharacterized protein (DUF736 family)